MANNPFDQFDGPAQDLASSGQNVFDQFDQPDDIVTLPTVQAERPDFSDVTSSWESTADQPGTAVGRSLGQYGGRQVLQGVGGLLGAIGGDAFNHYVVDPVRRRFHVPSEEDIAAGRDSFVPTASYRQIGEQIADDLGMQRPQTKAQRIVSDIGEGLTGTALTLGAGTAASGGRGLTQAAGEFFAANPVLQTAATVSGTGASSAVREAGGGTAAQIAAGVVGGFAPGTISALPGMRSGFVPQTVAGVTRGALRGRNAAGERVTAQDIDRAITDFAAAGTTPSVGQATGGRLSQAMETMLGNVPGGAGPIARLGAKQSSATGQAIERYAEQLSPRGRPMSPEQAGRAVLEGVEGKSPVAFVPKTAKKADELYDRVSQQVAPGTRVQVENTKQALSDLNASIEGAPNVAKLFQNARIQGIESALAKDIGGAEAALQRPDVRQQADTLRQQLNAQAERARAENMRLQTLGMRASQPVASPQQIDEQVKTAIAGMADNQIPYVALTKLRTLVGKELDNYSLADSVPRDKWKALYGALTRDMEAAATTPEAQQAWKRANAYYAARSNRIDSIAHVVDKNGGPEAVYKAAFGNTKEGATTLHAVMQSLPKDAQREMSASFIRRMGRATGSQQNADSDVFSMETFLTNWANMSPEAKRVLFDRHGMGFRQDMDKIARMTDRIRQGSAVFRNPSGSGRLISLITQSAGTASSAASALAAGSPLLAAGIVTSSASLAAAFNGLGRLMTSPGFVRWVAQNGEKPVGELISQAQTLRRIAESEGNDDVAEFAEQLEATKRPQSQSRQALPAR
ncbi:hypothetical protein [Stenotrophomonas indicatrix]|uniref:Uncharacterized protein n=1 Tax=Stenotrophomonas indicatrix TaxID=2045451 RepID=A0A1W1H068_9GAMM|nr:hypothetical protein [Stenotrophomonas indicatrix]SLM24881.1 hypothetical protein SAMN04488690_2609 [Stenotrophomonas indicatrix]